MNKVLASNWTMLLSVIVVVIGFRLAAQAGQGLDAIQNDGYAGSGGTLILIGGIILGMHIILSTQRQKRGKGKK